MLQSTEVTRIDRKLAALLARRAELTGQKAVQATFRNGVLQVSDVVDVRASGSVAEWQGEQGILTGIAPVVRPPPRIDNAFTPTGEKRDVSGGILSFGRNGFGLEDPTLGQLVVRSPSCGAVFSSWLPILVDLPVERLVSTRANATITRYRTMGGDWPSYAKPRKAS